MKLNNGKFFVVVFLLSALVFSFGLVWFSQTQKTTHLTDYTPEQLTSLFTAHASKGYAFNELKLVQLQQVEILEAADFQSLVAKYPFLASMEKLHINVKYNYVLPLNPTYKIAYEDSKLTFQNFNIELKEPLLTLPDVRLENRVGTDAEQLKIDDVQITQLILDMKPILHSHGLERMKNIESSFKDELTQHLVTWLRVQSIQEKPEVVVLFTN